MLPKFLIADNSQESQDKVYVVHSESPRCIIESQYDDFKTKQFIYWIDESIEGEELEAFLYEAKEFFEAELSNQEDLYDEEFDD